MIWKGEVVPIVYFYQDGKLVWDYVLPKDVERTEFGFRARSDENVLY